MDPDEAPPIATEDGSSSGRSVLEFSRRLQKTFGLRFLSFLGLTYFGIKGVAGTMANAALLPYFQAMGISGTNFQLASMVARFPWSTKGAVGTLSDCVPIGRYHKRGYLFISAAVGCYGLCMLYVMPIDSLGPSDIWSVASLFCCAILFFSTFDLLCEGKYSEVMNEESAGSEIVTLVWVFIQVGAIVGALAVGLVVDRQGPQALLAPCIPIALLAAWRTLAGDLPETPAKSWASLRKKALSEPELFKLALCMALGSVTVAGSATMLGRDGRAAVALSVSGGLIWYSFRALPKTLACSNLYIFLAAVANVDLTGPLAYFYTGRVGCIEDAPHFSYSYYLAVSNVVGSSCAVLGAVLFQFMQHWSFRRVFVVTALVQVTASIFDVVIVQRWNIMLGVSDEAAYLFGDAACQNIASQMAAMPSVVLISRLCPRGAEATVFALMAGFSNFGNAVSSMLGVYLCEIFQVVASRDGPCNFENLTMLIILCHAVAPVACLPLSFWLLPASRVDDAAAFENVSPAPSFRSAGSSPSSSPGNSPMRKVLEVARDAGDYRLMEDDGEEVMVARVQIPAGQMGSSSSSSSTVNRFS